MCFAAGNPPWPVLKIHKLRKPIDSPAYFWSIFCTSCIFKYFMCLVLDRLSYYHESENLPSSCQDSVHPGRLTLDKSHLFSQSIFGRIPNEKIPGRTVLIWSYTTDLSNAFYSIWHSGLFRQLIALDFPVYFVAYNCFFWVKDEQK